MKNLLKITILVILLSSCKNNQEIKKQDNTKQTIIKKKLSDSKKTEIVEYYLINKRKLAKKDFYKIVFLNDNIDNVKVIHYKGRDSFFTFRFSEALQFYKLNNK